MRVRLLVVGRLKDGPERELAERYRLRAAQLARSVGFSDGDTIELPEGRARRPPERRTEEASRIRDAAGTLAIALFDETGIAPTSEAFAERLRAERDAGTPGLAFVIGGPDGVADTLKAEARWTVSFGRMTLPHGLVRVLAQEQIYRAFTIIAGHPYHRATGAER